MLKITGTICIFLTMAASTAHGAPSSLEGLRTENTERTLQTAMARSLPYSQKHIDWCLRTYQGYQASDNTYYYSRNFRRQCTSPYYRAPNDRLRS